MHYSMDPEVFAPSQGQIANGIFGRANVLVKCDGITLVKLNNITIRKSKTGGYFLAAPSEKDRTGKKNEAGNDVYYPMYKMFPENPELYQLLVNSVVEALGRAAPRSQTSGTTTRPPSSRAPVNPSVGQVKPSVVPKPSATQEFDFS